MDALRCPFLSGAKILLKITSDLSINLKNI